MATTAEKGPEDWQIDSDLRTLAEAEEIRKDPKRFKAALARAKEKIAALQAVQEEADEDKNGKAD
ncbi:hypothetical protein [Variovorax sp. PMC12]|uniref:hypothetical protein n=1 Tax=Variovorax sp. PMC12 TaxID=2126319 RepID=UPI000D115791|nr:hypothetical protein [Variovorax sp. PMC12]AVQ81659.1 hypothetical protein C4F17_12255 [Variovorax sp. PMC12]